MKTFASLEYCDFGTESMMISESSNCLSPCDKALALSHSSDLFMILFNWETTDAHDLLG